MPASREHKAVESLTLEEASLRMRWATEHAASTLGLMAQVAPLPPGAVILDIGAAQGQFVIACSRLGYQAVGVEPSAEACRLAAELAERESATVQVVQGAAERLPFESCRFDAVHAMSVIEHVLDAEAAFREACRVLKPGGVFWFYTASSLCPRQDEIRGFPLFGWYPDGIKRRIMAWAVRSKPHLVGRTTAPAIHWFTPAKARRMLAAAGFGKVFDRWQIPRPPGGSVRKRAALSLIRSCVMTRFLADVCLRGCAYAAVR